MNRSARLPFDRVRIVENETTKFGIVYQSDGQFSKLICNKLLVNIRFPVGIVDIKTAEINLSMRKINLSTLRSTHTYRQVKYCT